MYLAGTPLLLSTLTRNNIIWKINTSEKELFITFDDGPVPEVSPEVLRILNDYHAKASFFMVGENVKKHPQIFEEILANGHAVGNHTYNHVNGLNVKNNFYYENIQKSYATYKTVLFRPPYGMLSIPQMVHLQKKFYIILWSVMSGDFDKKTTKEQCLENSLIHSEKGSIIVFHDSLKAKEKMLWVLPQYLDFFSKQGYTFKALSAKDCKHHI